MIESKTRRPAWTIWKGLGLALMGSSLFQLLAHFATGQPEFPLGALLTFHWGLIWFKPAWLVKLRQDQPWFDLINALPVVLGLLVLILDSLGSLPLPVNLDWAIFLLYTVNLVDSLDSFKKGPDT